MTPLVANSNAFESGLVINITTNPVEAQQNITNISILSDQLKGYTTLPPGNQGYYPLCILGHQ